MSTNSTEFHLNSLLIVHHTLLILCDFISSISPQKWLTNLETLIKVNTPISGWVKTCYNLIVDIFICNLLYLHRHTDLLIMAEPGNQISKGERSRSKITKKTKPESFYENRNSDCNDEATTEMANECSEFMRKRKSPTQHLEPQNKGLKSKGSKSSSGRDCNKSGKSIFNTDNIKEIWHMTFNKSDSIEESERSLKVKFTRKPDK